MCQCCICLLENVFHNMNLLHFLVFFTCRWVPDSDVSMCYQCGEQFGAVCRKHHCRQCGRVYCSKCCQHKVINPTCTCKYDNCFTGLATSRMFVVGDNLPLSSPSLASFPPTSLLPSLFSVAPQSLASISGIMLPPDSFREGPWGKWST